MNSTTKSILRKTGELLADPAKRCEKTLATDKEGLPVMPSDPKACHWCLAGALMKTTADQFPDSEPGQQIEIYHAAKTCLGLTEDMALPCFWDDYPGLHSVIASRLKEAK